MEKFNKELFSFEDDPDLTFTKEDRMETMKKIKERQNSISRKPTFNEKRKIYLGPLLATAAVFVLTIGLIYQYVFSGAELSQENQSRLRAGQSTQQENLSFSVLLMGDDLSEDNKRKAEVYLLFTYNSSDNSVKLVHIPRDTYTEIYDSDGKVVSKGKLMHASALVDSFPQSVLTTVSNLFDMPIDYYSFISLERIIDELDINKNDKAGDQSSTSYFGDALKEQFTFSNLINLLKDSETNIPSDVLDMSEVGGDKVIDIIEIDDGSKVKHIEGIYYVIFDQNKLDEITEILKNHLDKGKDVDKNEKIKEEKDMIENEMEQNDSDKEAVPENTESIDDILASYQIEKTEFSSLESYVEDLASSLQPGSEYLSSQTKETAVFQLAYAGLRYVNYFAEEIEQVGMTEEFKSFQRLAYDLLETHAYGTEDEFKQLANEFEEKINQLAEKFYSLK